MRSEAHATPTGVYITAAEMLSNGQFLPDEWRNKIFFIDALDESFHADHINAPLQINSILRQLGQPGFRISCRVADWKTITDLSALSGGYSVKPKILQLQALEEDEILSLLKEQNVEHKERLLLEVRSLGLEELLKNPATLLLLVKAWQSESRPDSRKALYEQACKQLLSEFDDARAARASREKPRIATDTLMNNAGQLCATLLLSGKEGVCLHPGDSRNSLYPSLEETGCSQLDGMQTLLDSRLWSAVPAADGLLKPVHRSVAEYLAARWISGAVVAHSNPLPSQRINFLLLDAKGRVISALKGLYAWMGTLSLTFQEQFINADPLTLVYYGDPKSLPLKSKRLLLDSLKAQADVFSGFRHLSHDDKAFGQLFDPALLNDFATILSAEARCASHEAYLSCILSILAHADDVAALKAELFEVLEDAGHWPANRNAALRVWIQISQAGEQESLLRAIKEGKVDDADDELTGILLRSIYPASLSATDLIEYLHPPKNRNLLGNYWVFFEHLLAEVTSDESLGELLSALSENMERVWPVEGERLFRFTDTLLQKALLSQGDQASDDELYGWLGVGRDHYGHISRSNETRESIRSWLEQRPERYKAVLLRCIRAQASNHREFHFDRLHAAKPPPETGEWHLEQAAIAPATEATIHVQHAVQRLLYKSEEELLDLEKLEAWQQQHPQYDEVIRNLLFCPVEDWRQKIVSSQKSWKQQQAERRQQRSRQLQPLLSSIATGAAPASLMQQLEGVWSGRFADVQGDTVAARFEAYSIYGESLMHMAESGFKKCLGREDLPAAIEVINLWRNNKFPRIGKACQAGILLRWQEEPESLHGLSESTLATLVALELCWPSGDVPDWFGWLATQQPTLFGSTYIGFARAAFKTRNMYLPYLFQFKLWPEAARIMAPALLKAFPARTRKENLKILRSLMHICFQLDPVELAGLCKRKLSLKSLDQAQGVYWQAMAFLLDPESESGPLLERLGNDQQKSYLLADYLFGDGHWSEQLDLSGLPTSILARLIVEIGPKAQANRQSGVVTAEMERGEQVREMINLLAAQPTEKASAAFEQLIAQPSLKDWHFYLQKAHVEQASQLRESRFRYLDLDEVIKVLNNREPATQGDLAALILYQLDELARDIRHGDNNCFEAFWNIPDWTRRNENPCRNHLLTRLEDRLRPYHISAHREVHHRGDTRSDMLFIHSNIRLPVEVKCDWNKGLWSGLRDQLIEQYASQPAAEGYGIYLVLWFGDIQSQQAARDGGRKPQTPEELERRLTATLSVTEQKRIFVRVIDVSRPV